MTDLTRKISKAEYAKLTDEQKKERYRAQKKAHKQKPESKAQQKAYAERPEIKARAKAYQAKPEIKARMNEASKKYRQSEKGKAKKKAYMKAYRASKKTHYVLYKHTNSEGYIYVGCGSNLRPFELKASRRSLDWNKAFLGASICIELLDTFDTKKEAREAKRELIRAIGLDNLVNINN